MPQHPWQPRHRVTVLDQVQPGAGFQGRQGRDQQGPLLLPEALSPVQQLHWRWCAQGAGKQAQRRAQQQQVQQPAGGADQRRVRQQRSMGQKAAVGPPQQPQWPPAAGGVGARVQIGRQQQPSRQKAATGDGRARQPQPRPPQGAKGQGQGPGDAVVGAASSHGVSAAGPSVPRQPAQWVHRPVSSAVERLPYKLDVAGSKPAPGMDFSSEVSRQARKMRANNSMPAVVREATSLHLELTRPSLTRSTDHHSL